MLGTESLSPSAGHGPGPGNLDCVLAMPRALSPLPSGQMQSPSSNHLAFGGLPVDLFLSPPCAGDDGASSACFVSPCNGKPQISWRITAKAGRTLHHAISTKKFSPPGPALCFLVFPAAQHAPLPCSSSLRCSLRDRICLPGLLLLFASFHHSKTFKGTRSPGPVS